MSSTPDRAVQWCEHWPLNIGLSVLLGKTLYSHSASLHPGGRMVTGEYNAGGNPAIDQPPIQGWVEIFLVASCYRNRRLFFFPVEEPLKVESGLRAPVPQVLSLEIESYEQHVYSQEPFSFYIKGKLRDGYVTLKRYRWEVKEAMRQEQFHHEVTVLR